MKTTDSQIIAQRKQELEIRLNRKSPFRCSESDPALWFEVSGRHSASSQAGVAAVMELAYAVGLDKALDSHLGLLSERSPYSESGHIMAIAACVLAGGTCPEHLRALRQTPEFMDLLGVNRLPDASTSGDFLRRFKTEDDAKDFIQALLTVTEQVLVNKLPADERRVAKIDADGTFTSTDAECRQGVGYSGHKKDWGFQPLLITLSNTGQLLALKNRPGNETSSQGAAEYLDIAIESMLRVFEEILLRGDTDFSQTKHLDGWDETGRVKFVFGYDACPNLVDLAHGLTESAWTELVRPARYVVKTKPRTKPERIKPQIVKQMNFVEIHTVREDTTEFEYQPTACKKAYRMVVTRKLMEVTQGQLVLEPQVRYFFHITNRRDLTQAEVVKEANQRCNQENLIAQLAGQVQALKATSNTLLSNWAWMLSASVAWTLKGWFGLFAPSRAERQRIITMEWRTFQQCFINMAAEPIKSGRRRIIRLLGGHLPSMETFLRICADIRRLRLVPG